MRLGQTRRIATKSGPPEAARPPLSARGIGCLPKTLPRRAVASTNSPIKPGHKSRGGLSAQNRERRDARYIRSGALSSSPFAYRLVCVVAFQGVRATRRGHGACASMFRYSIHGASDMRCASVCRVLTRIDVALVLRSRETWVPESGARSRSRPPLGRRNCAQRQLQTGPELGS